MLLKPNIKLKRITDISVSLLEKYNIDTLILDVDNTMSTHHGEILTDGLTDWIDMMHKNNIKLIVLSNSKEARVKPFAEKINLPYISLGLKPLPFGYIKALKKADSNRKNTAIVGDQIFTDVLGANRMGIFSVYTTPILKYENWFFYIKRFFEKFILNKIK